MSVRTTADEKLDSAKAHVEAALKDLTDIVVHRERGYSDYDNHHRNFVFPSWHATLLKLRNEMFK